MGKLIIKFKSEAGRWIVPLVVAAAITAGLQAAVRADSPDLGQLASYLQTGQLSVGSTEIDGYEQVYYVFSGQRYFVTSGEINHTEPVSSGEFVAWMAEINGGYQIVLYDVLTGAQVQLTTLGVNEHPAISQNQVAWQALTDGHWHVNYYDGSNAYDLTPGDTKDSSAPDINGGQIVYATQTGPNRWDDMSYDTANGQYHTLAHDAASENAFPHFVDGKVVNQLP